MSAGKTPTYAGRTKVKVVFEVIEDDDECSLSKQIDELKEK